MVWRSEVDVAVAGLEIGGDERRRQLHRGDEEIVIRFPLVLRDEGDGRKSTGQQPGERRRNPARDRSFGFTRPEAGQEPRHLDHVAEPVFEQDQEMTGAHGFTGPRRAVPTKRIDPRERIRGGPVRQTLENAARLQEMEAVDEASIAVASVTMNGSRQIGACGVRPAEGVMDLPAQNERRQVFPTTVDVAGGDRETAHPKGHSSPDLGDPERVACTLDSGCPGPETGVDPPVLQTFEQAVGQDHDLQRPKRCLDGSLIDGSRGFIESVTEVGNKQGIPHAVMKRNRDRRHSAPSVEHDRQQMGASGGVVWDRPVGMVQGEGVDRGRVP